MSEGETLPRGRFDVGSELFGAGGVSMGFAVVSLRSEERVENRRYNRRPSYRDVSRDFRRPPPYLIGMRGIDVMI